MPDNKRIVALLLRHGSTEANELDQYRSMMNPCLDGKGIKQAEQAADFLGRYDLERIVTSPMLRAYQTACIIQLSFQHVPLIQDQALMPWNLGFLSGKDRTAYADILNLYVQEPQKTVPDGEPLNSLKIRTKQFFTQEFERDEGLTLYVAHTSNLITLSNMVNGGDLIQAEVGEAVGPGGVLAIYEGSNGLEIEPIYGAVKEPEYGVS